jgi:hypothetical protein
MRIIAGTDITHRGGLIKGPRRSFMLENYKFLKKGYLTCSTGIAVTNAVVEFGKDVASSSLKMYGYKFAALILPGPALTSIGGVLYTITKWTRLKALGVTIFNLGGAIIKGELVLYDVIFLVPDLVLFGEYVPTFADTSALYISNETQAVESLLGNYTNFIPNVLND